LLLTTRLPSNLRFTTRETVHLLRVVTSGHVTKMAVTSFDPPFGENPVCMPHTPTGTKETRPNRNFQCVSVSGTIWRLHVKINFNCLDL